MSVGSDLDLVVRYQAADVSNTVQTFQVNTAVIKALVAKFPEFRDAFDGRRSPRGRAVRTRLRIDAADERDKVEGQVSRSQVVRSQENQSHRESRPSLVLLRPDT